MTKKILLATSLLFFVTQCGGSGSSSDSDFFFTQAKQVAPVVTPTVASSLVAANGSTWTWGNIMYELFDLLRDYDNARDQGTVGISNMYKTLYQTSEFYANEVNSCVAITAQTVVSPYDVGTRNTYNCAGSQNSGDNHFAMDTSDANIKKALMTWHVTNSGANNEYGVIEGNYNETTKDILVDLAAYCDYTDQNDYSQRLYISGNADTHTFTLKSMKYSGGSGYKLSIVGYGVSKGEGQKFLFKVQDNENALTPKYFCFDAEATEAELEAMVTQTGSDTVPAGCEAYEDEVEALILYTEADVPKALSEFANSSIALSYQ